MADDPSPSVLLVEGMSCVGMSWYSDTLLGSGEHMEEDERSRLQALWAEDVERVDFRYGQGASLVQERIGSGRFKAIVVCDLSDAACMPAFESALGSHLRAFASAGGYVLFPTSEGGLLQGTLQKLFEVPWRRSSYSRTTWGVPPARASRVAELFGLDAPVSFTAKACSIRNAGADACFGVTVPEHESRIMNASSVTSPEGLEEEDLDVCCAVRDVSNGGKVAFFGDVNAEYATRVLVASLCRHAVRNVTAPSLLSVTVSDMHALDEDEFAKVLELKSRGNDAFRAGDWSGRLWEAALTDVYGERRLGTPGAQRETKVALLSNLSEASLRREDYDAADSYASRALEIDEGCVKARVRRVKAVVSRLEQEPHTLREEVDCLREEIEHVKCDLRNEATLPPDLERLTRRIDQLVATARAERREHLQRARDFQSRKSPREEVTPVALPPETSLSVDDATLSAAQAALDAAAPGTLVRLCAGVFADDEEEGTAPRLVLRKPLFLVGDGSEATTLDATLEVALGDDHNQKVTIKGLGVKRGATFRRNFLERIDVLDCKFEQKRNDDCLVFEETPAKVLVSGCTIVGGSDGLAILGSQSKVHVYETKVKSASCRGIFADPHFIIEDSSVTGCGSCGMKTRSGCARRGSCNIQAGPWDGLASAVSPGLGGDFDDDDGDYVGGAFGAGIGGGNFGGNFGAFSRKDW